MDEDGKEKEPAKPLSTVKQSLHIEYNEDGIRLAYRNIKAELNTLEHNAAQKKKQFEGFEEFPEELKELREKLKKIQQFDTAEHAKTEYEHMQERMKSLKKDLADIEKAVGSRINFKK